MAHAAASPKMVFSGTVIAATMRVSLIAAHESGSASALQNGITPLLNAWAKTLNSGRNRKTTAKVIATEMSSHFTNGDSSVPRLEAVVVPFFCCT
jgi:hypothetical protein